jgi:hypothetical protein
MFPSAIMLWVRAMVLRLIGNLCGSEKSFAVGCSKNGNH